MSVKIARRAFTDLLGVPEDSTNDEVLAALDARLAAKAAKAAATAAPAAPDDSYPDHWKRGGVARADTSTVNFSAPPRPGADDAYPAGWNRD